MPAWPEPGRRRHRARPDPRSRERGADEPRPVPHERRRPHLAAAGRTPASSQLTFAGQAVADPPLPLGDAVVDRLAVASAGRRLPPQLSRHPHGRVPTPDRQTGCRRWRGCIATISAASWTPSVVAGRSSKRSRRGRAPNRRRAAICRLGCSLPPSREAHEDAGALNWRPAVAKASPTNAKQKSAERCRCRRPAVASRAPDDRSSGSALIRPRSGWMTTRLPASRALTICAAPFPNGRVSERRRPDLGPGAAIRTIADWRHRRCARLRHAPRDPQADLAAR